MRRFLYISPYFPPQTRVGALRPLKFLRHLEPLGWQAVVLCDLHSSDPVDPALLEAVPASTTVVRDYSLRAQGNSRAFFASSGKPRAPKSRWRLRSLLPTAARDWVRRVEGFVGQNPELIPLGENSVDLPHAILAARRALARHPCDAVVVNADPYAALLVGRIVAQEAGLPFIADLRDPWAPCEIRRPMRPLPQLKVVDRMERWVVEAAHTVILNTDSTREAYRAHYSDLPESRFITIRNHSDAALIDAPARPPEPHFTLLFLGHLRRFVEGDTLFGMLAELKRRGHGASAVKLHVVGTLPSAVRERAVEQGVLEQVVVEPPVPYRQIAAVMKSADLMIAVSHSGRQRIPAKVYDYLTVPRPILAITDNAELSSLLHRAGGGHSRGLGDAKGCADVVEQLLARGRGVNVERHDVGTASHTAARQLSDVLHDACKGLT